jgi:uncharacterized metal-binding protein
MPSGKIHAEITLAAAALTYAWGLKSGETPVLAAAAAAGCAAGVLINPDLDVVGTRADRLVRETNFFLAIIWGILWYPYSALIPHRSLISHSPVIGTFIRILYMMIPVLLLGIRIQPGPLLVRGIGGLVISDNLHVAADFLVTGIREIYENNKDSKTNN